MRVQDPSTLDESLAPYETGDCEMLGPLEHCLRGKTALVADCFRAKLVDLPHARALFDVLTAREQADLHDRLAAYLVALASPQLTAAQHCEMATRLGVVHAATGLARSDVGQCYWAMVDAIRAYAGEHVSAGALMLYGERLSRDLVYQGEAYARAEAERLSVHQRLAKLVWNVRSYVTLADDICALLSGLTGVACCALVRVDDNGKVYFEAASGANEADLLELEEAAHAGLLARPIWQAWNSGDEKAAEIAHRPSTATMTDVHGRRCRDLGIRSGAALPLGCPGKPVQTVMMLYCTYPGGLGSPEQRAFLGSLKSLLDIALARMGVFDRGACGIPRALRRRVRELLYGEGLEMYYQPIVDLKSGNVIKVEALARLRDGSRLLMPGDFLPALSAEDLLELYGQSLNQAMRHRSEWQAQGVTLGVSVNLPQEALGDPRYYDATHAVLAAYPCPLGTLTLELLECGELTPGRLQSSTMEQLRALGVELAEDDLGAGYSSLMRLRQLPFDWIKLDRGMIKLADGDNTGVLHFILQLTRLGHGLGKRVVVEGVETADLWEAVQLLGVDAAQGYLVARPMPGSAIVPWLHKHEGQQHASHPRTPLGRQACALVSSSA